MGIILVKGTSAKLCRSGFYPTYHNSVNHHSPISQSVILQRSWWPLYCFHYLELLEQPVCSGAGICNSLLPSLTDIDSNVCDWSVASNFFLDSLIIIVNQSCCLESVSSLITRQASCVSIMPWLQTFYWFRLRFPASVFFNKFIN